MHTHVEIIMGWSFLFCFAFAHIRLFYSISLCHTTKTQRDATQLTLYVATTDPKV